jgi:integrase
MATKRRQKGEGSITEYIKGHFRAYLDLGKDPVTGKRVRKTFTGASKAEVIAKLNKAKYEKQEGLLTITKSTPLSLYCNHWLSVKKAQVREGTYAIYEYTVGILSRSPLGAKRINEIKLVELNEFFSSLTGSSAGKSRTKAITSNIFKLAVREQLIASNPVDLVDSIKVVKKEIQPLTVDEVRILLLTAKSYKPYYYLLKLTVEAGLRKGEALGLHWSDIDFKENTITIRRVLKVLKGEQYIGEPKTQTSKRTLSVSPETLKELLEIRKEDCDIVFSNGVGNYLNYYKVANTFKKILKEAGLREDTRFHDLRHTNATLLIAKGINMKTVSERLGHSSITITLDRYTHGVKEEDQKAAKVIDTLL